MNIVESWGALVSTESFKLDPPLDVPRGFKRKNLSLDQQSAWDALVGELCALNVRETVLKQQRDALADYMQDFLDEVGAQRRHGRSSAVQLELREELAELDDEEVQWAEAQSAAQKESSETELADKEESVTDPKGKGRAL